MFRASRIPSSLSKLKLPSAAVQRPRLQLLPRSAALAQTSRFATKSDDENPPPPKWPIDREAELKVAHKKLESNPSAVTIDSSRSKVFDAEPRTPGSPGDPSLQAGIQHDINIFKSTFRLDDVPRESRILGLAGTVPYLVTSLSTVFLAWDITKTLPTGNWLYDAILVNRDTAHYLLSVIEPVQLGYGAIIISFLGAIHWGLEYAEKEASRQRTRFRYGMGLAASIIAWPTLYMPLEYALISQFLAFVGLYFADSNAAKRGWAPRWYGIYRFLLTAMVGAAIFISLVGRASITRQEHLGYRAMESHMRNEGIADHNTNWEKLEAEERARNRKKKEAEEKAKKEAEKEQKAKEKKEKSKPGKKPQDESKSGDKSSKQEGEEASKDEDKKQDGEDANKENESTKEEGENKDKDDESKEGKDEESKEDTDEESKEDKGDESKKEKPKDDGEEKGGDKKKSGGEEKKKKDDE
ncbi:hypothetical protein B0I35DRAFT_356191 [Stachybotrys elegans]|uniref:Mitochondrial inner membrane protein 1 n=1 Tax=Stachybotrys elegans TaxID=80388 RepID=A0A8K0SLF0_9HYPO|nr:hypothetical protein B0I35DRAFT_356191 [Stachybotrys elegans]